MKISPGLLLALNFCKNYNVQTDCSNISSSVLLHVSGHVAKKDVFGYITSSSTFPTSASCSLPPLLEGRYAHTAAFLPGGKLVICGGRDSNSTILDSCLSWENGNSTWQYFYTLRYWYNHAGVVSILVVGWQDTMLISGHPLQNPTSSS